MLVWFFLIEMEQEFSAMAKDPKCTSVEFQVGPRESALLRAMTRGGLPTGATLAQGGSNYLVGQLSNRFCSRRA
jgi:hypothetical protein